MNSVQKLQTNVSDERAVAAKQLKLQKLANHSAQAHKLQDWQVRAHVAPQAAQLAAAQRDHPSRGQSANQPSATGAPSVTLQRKIAYENPVEGDQNTIEELRKTNSGGELVRNIEGHQEKTCTVHWAETRTEEMFAQPANASAAADPLSGSDVRVNIPIVEGDAGDKYQHLMVDGGGENKMPATVVALHELVHAYAAMRGAMVGLEKELVHSVFEGEKLKRKEVIPLEEVLTMGLKDSDNHTHRYHDLKTGADITDAVREKIIGRGITENDFRLEQENGVRSAYVSNENAIPSTDQVKLEQRASDMVKDALDECKQSVLNVKMFANLLTLKRDRLSPAWQRNIDAAPNRVDTWLNQIKVRQGVSVRNIIDHLDQWEGKVKDEVNFINERHALFRQRVLEKWRAKFSNTK